ncbi:hypothetical protein ACTFIZ_011406 [Dictyostelium cf. discoideum]
MEKGEILFWKVYRNIVINKIIYSQLLNTEIEFDYDKYYVGNRRRYGDIHSFKWFIDNGQLDLLKYKLQKNEYVYELCLQYLFKSISNPLTYSISMEILEIILNKSEYREIINYSNILKNILIYNNNEILELVIKNYWQYYKHINWFKNDHLEYSIKNCSQPIINNLLKFIDKNKIKQDFKNNSIYWSLKNKYDVDGSITNIILNDNGLFNLKKIDLIIPFQLTSGKIDVLIRLMDLDFFNDTSDISCFCYHIRNSCKSKQLLKIETILFFFKLYYKCTTSKTIIPNEIKLQIDEILKDNNINYECIEIIEKQLLKLLIKSTKSKIIYSLFYYNYYELIDGMDNHCFKLLKTNEILMKLNKLVDKNETIEFLTSFLNELPWGKRWFKNLKLADQISDLIFNKFDCYKEVLDKVGKEKLRFIKSHYLKISSINQNFDSISKQFLKSIIEYDVNKTNILIGQIDMEKFINHWNKTIKQKGDQLFKGRKINFTPNSMFQKIKDYFDYWIEKTKIKSIIPVCEIIINFLFRKLLQFQDMTCQQIKNIKSQFDCIPIELEHSIFHSFLYLHIKSKKIIKYILSFNKLFYGNTEGTRCPCRTCFVENLIKEDELIKKIIKADIFTFENIFNDERVTFEYLFNHFSNLHTKSVNLIKHQLNYLLEIDRLDLFIIILEEIALNKSIGCEYLCVFEINFVKQLIRSNDYNKITTTLKRFIELVIIINGKYGLEFPQKMLSIVMKLYLKDLTSFIINEYKLTSIRYLDLTWYHSPMIEYLCKSHPNVNFKILENIGASNHSHFFIQILKLAINCNRISDLNIAEIKKIATNSNDQILLNILSKNGLNI